MIRLSSDEDCTVLDPFCGCGTTIEAAERLGRRWIGIDIAVYAVKVIEDRIAERIDRPIDFTVEGMPQDFASAEELARRDKYQFEWWANYLFDPHALKDRKRGADRGIDGRIFFMQGPGQDYGQILTSVKGGDNLSPGMIRDFAGVLEREGAELGLFITLRPPTKAMRSQASAAGFYDWGKTRIPRLQIVSIAEWFEGKRPILPEYRAVPVARASATAKPKAKSGKRPDPKQREMLLPTPSGDTAAPVSIGDGWHLNPKMARPAVGKTV